MERFCACPRHVPTMTVVSPLWRHIRPQDLVWLLAFSVLAIASPERDPIVLTLLVALGVVQVIEPRTGVVPSVILKLVLSYFIIGYSGGISSSLYLILLLPVITAATNFDAWGTAAPHGRPAPFIFRFSSTWASTTSIVPPGKYPKSRSCTFIPVVAFLTYQLASQKRNEAHKLQETAQRLQEAQAEVRRADRLAALGQLTAGLAHELRNPLGTMKSSAELLERNVPADNAHRHGNGRVHLRGSGPYQFADHAVPGISRVPSTCGWKRATLPRCWITSSALRTGEVGRAPAVSVYKNYSPDVPPVCV